MAPRFPVPPSLPRLRLAAALGAALLSAITTAHPVWAQTGPEAAGSPTYPQELQDTLRKALTAYPISQLSEARVSSRGMDVFHQVIERRLAAVPIESLVNVQISMQFTLPDSPQEKGQEQESLLVPGEASFMILLNFEAINAWISDVCRDALPRISAVDRSRSRPMCDGAAKFAAPSNP